MGQRGPQKKDPALLSRRKAADRFRKVESAGASVIDMVPAAPAALSPEAQKEWRRMAEKLARMGWLNAPGKLEHLRVAAQLLARFDREQDEFPPPLYAQMRQAVNEVFRQPRLDDIERPDKKNPFDDF